MEPYFELFPERKDDLVWKQILEWVKVHGAEMAKLHTTTIYGDDALGLLPSRLFTEDQYGKYLEDVTMELTLWFHQLLYIGKELNALSTDDERQLSSIINVESVNNPQAIAIFRQLLLEKFNVNHV